MRCSSSLNVPKLTLFSLCFCAGTVSQACGGSEPAAPAEKMSGTGGAGGTAGAHAGSGGSGVAAGGTAGRGAGGSTPIAGTGAGATGGSATGGSAGTGGSAAGMPSTGGSGGLGGGAGTGAGATGGGAGTGGAGGSGQAGSGGGTPTACTFNVTHTQSTAIPTVETVTFTTDLAGIDKAHIDFGPTGGPLLTAPVDLAEPMYKTLLLGMKGSKDYTFHIVASAGDKSCTSEDFTLKTGAVPSSVPKITKSMATAAASKGFIVACQGVSFGGGMGGGGAVPTYIFDTDGDVVWWAAAPTGASRAHMSWDGKTMWMQELNVDNGGGEMRSVSMDGTNPQNNVTGLDKSHHDFTVLPDNSLAMMLWNTTGMDAHNSLIERSASGTIKTIVPDVNVLYQSSTFHPNAIHYYQSDDSFTFSDRNVNAFFKIKHTGELLWQLGGSNPKGKSFTLSGLSQWQVNHGHELTSDNHFIFFNNGSGSGNSTVYDVLLDETAGTATKTWSYAGGSSMVLGDVERLKNGNAFITFSTSGTIQEVDASGAVVQQFKATSFGYSDFRESLYGPPPRP